MQIRKRHYAPILLLVCFSLLLFGCENPFKSENNTDVTDISALYSMQMPTMTDTDNRQEVDVTDAAEIQFADTEVFVSGGGASAAGTYVTVTRAGTYLVTGECADGQLIVDAGDKDTVCLVFQNVTLASKTSAAVYVKNAGRTVLNAAKNTVNTLSDATQYTNQADGEPDAAVYSKDDLTVNGLGVFQITGNYQDAVKSKDTLRITGSTLTVQSADDGLCGKDFVCVSGGEITIVAAGDGIKSTYDTDFQKGAVAVSGGNISVTAGADGVQAQNKVQIDSGTLHIVSGGGAAEAAQKASANFPMYPQNETDSTASDGSYKGVKCGYLVSVTGGTLDLNCADDAVHSNHTVEIGGGSFTVQSGDDGIHADTALTVTGGNIEITQSYEGLEAAKISLQGGEIHVTASDDGVNAAGGKDNSQQNSRFGGDPFSADESLLEITGGKLVVDASGDGLDSNGDIVLSGGEVYIHGPTDDGNGALDYAGTFTATGGMLFAAGSSGMAQSISETSSAYAVAVGVEAQENTAVRLLRADGSEACSFAPRKRFSHLVIVSPEIQKGESYTVSTAVFSGGENADGLLTGASYTQETVVGTFTAESVSSAVGNAWGGFGGGKRGGMPNENPEGRNPADGISQNGTPPNDGAPRDFPKQPQNFDGGEPSERSRIF